MGTIKTLYLTIRVDFEPSEEFKDYDLDELESEVAEIIADRVNAHNHSIEDGIRIDNVEVC